MVTSEQWQWLYKYDNKDSVDKLNILKEKYLNKNQKIKYIHVTGTNGKGSVSRYLHDVLVKNLNLKVGLFTSPHIKFLNERIIINNQKISDEQLLEIKNLIFEDVEKYKLGFFAILTLIALIYFCQENVDWAIIEVGIGGLKDSTNIIKSDYCVITSIAQDHKEVLGRSKIKILKQKMGIIKNSTKVLFVSGNLSHFLKFKIYLKMKFKNKETILKFSKKNKHEIYFYQNQKLVIKIINYLFPNLKNEEIYETMKKTENNLRFQLIQYNKQNLYLDVAHNIAGAKALIKVLKYNNIKIDCIIFSALTNKDYQKIIKILTAKSCSNIFIFQNSHMLSITGKKFQLQTLADYKNILVTGSCYFVSDVYNLLIEKIKEK